MSSSIVLIIAFICLAIGFLAGLLVASLTSNQATSEADLEDSQPKSKAEHSTELSLELKDAAPLQVVQPVNNELETDVPEHIEPSPGQIMPPPAFNGRKEVKPEVKQKPEPKNGLAGSESMVQQIDAILQDQIIGTGLFSKGVRLVEMPDQGVMVWIGLKPYHGIDAVDDPEVVAAIHKAVQSWETRGD